MALLLLFISCHALAAHQVAEGVQGRAEQSLRSSGSFRRRRRRHHLLQFVQLPLCVGWHNDLTLFPMLPHTATKESAVVGSARRLAKHKQSGGAGDPSSGAATTAAAPGAEAAASGCCDQLPAGFSSTLPVVVVSTQVGRLASRTQVDTRRCRRRHTWRVFLGQALTGSTPEPPTPTLATPTGECTAPSTVLSNWRLCRAPR